MRCPFSPKKVFLSFLGFMAASLLLLCSENPEQPTGPDNTEPPTLKITQPAGDTTVASYADSIVISGAITIGEGVTILGFTVNDSSYLHSIAATNLLSLTLPLPVADTTDSIGDTTQFILKFTDSKSREALDTVLVIRPGVTQPGDSTPDITEGKALLSGTMYKPGSGAMAKRLSKSIMVANAAGTTADVDSVLPLTGADILVYNADSVATSSTASTKTDSTGKWSLEIEPGNYFIFAVWFDQENLDLLTASIQNVTAEEGKATTADSTVALIDDVSPLILTFLDAQSADDNNTFLATNLPEGLPLVITFSEPMNRNSVGGDTTGIVLGEIDPTDTDLALKSTIPVKKVWSATSKELRLIPTTPLTVGKYYKVVMPSTIKDLALNKVGSVFYGVFSVIARSELPAFAVKGANVQAGDTIGAMRNIEIGFTRPIDGVILNKSYSISPAINCFFEAKGNTARLSFPAENSLLPSTAYTLTIASGAKDLLGDTLSAPYSLSFVTRAVDTNAASGATGGILGFVTRTMEAYLTQDIERFAASFHPLLEVTDIHMEEGKEVSSKQTLDAFVRQMKADATMKKQLAIEGVLFPKTYKMAVGTDTLRFRKLLGKTGVGTAPAGKYLFIEDVGGGGFKQPQILDSTGTSINSSVTYRGDTLIAYNDLVFIANIPQNMAFFSDDKDKRDPSYFGKLMNEKTSMEMEVVKITMKESYTIRMVDTANWGATPPSAAVLFDIVTTETMSNDPVPRTHVQAINITVVRENGRLWVRQMVAKSLFEGTKDDFETQKNDLLNDKNFNQNEFKSEATRAIELITPAQKAVGVTAPVAFAWSKVPAPQVKGYILCLSNEISGGQSGMLIFTNDTTVTIGADGAVTGGTVLNLDPTRMNAPIPRFSKRLTVFDTLVYVWKVIGVGDSVAGTITGQLNIFADSDFRQSRQPGFFTTATVMPDLSMMMQAQSPMPGPGGHMNDFADSDGDGYPDWMEVALGTDKNDAGSKPDLLIDSDKDGIADFFEIMFGTNPDDATSKPEDANNNRIPDTLERAATWDPRLEKDTDGDGWADEIEMILGSDPWNPKSFPQTYAKGTAPTGSYKGKFFIQADNQEYDIAVTIFTDTATGSAKAIIDSSGLNIIRAGESVDLAFMFGEWVFFYKIIAGANTGRYLKFRARTGYQMVEGAVDVADMINGGGPYIGQWKATVGGDVGSISGGGHQPINPMPGTGGMIGPAPQSVLDLLKNPPTDAKTVNLALVKGETGLQCTLSLGGETILVSHEAMWQPQMYPMFIFRFKDSTGELRLEGALFKDSTMIMSGEILKNNMLTSRFSVSNAAATETTPDGTWRGYAVPSSGHMPGPGSMGPLAFIGTKDSVFAALSVTQNMVMDIKDSVPFPTNQVWMEGVWKCKDTSGTRQFQILEKPNTMPSVYIGKDKTGAPVVLVMLDGNAGPAMPPPNHSQLPEFSGPETMIRDMLMKSGNKVQVVSPNGMDLRVIMVDPTTIKQVSPDPAKPAYKIQENPANPRLYTFAAVAPGGSLMIRNNLPCVGEEAAPVNTQPTGPIAYAPYGGDIGKIQNALMSTGGSVQVADPAFFNFTGEGVDAASLKPYADSLNPAIIGFVARDRRNSARVYLFMADSATGMLAMRGGQPVVKELEGGAQPPAGGQMVLVPFRGAPSEVQNALASSYEWVQVKDSTFMRSEPVIISSVKTVMDPMDSAKVIMIASWRNNPQTTYLFLADSATGKLAMDGNRPIVKEIKFTGEITQKTGSYIPYTGPVSPNVKDALMNAGSMVRVVVKGSTSMLDALVDQYFIRTFSDSAISPGILVKVRDRNDTLQFYLFMADSAAGPSMLGLDNGRPVVTALPRLISTQPTLSYKPFSGDMAAIQNALTNAMNNVQVGDPTFTKFYGEMVDPASLIIHIDSTKPGETMYAASSMKDPNRKFIFMADSATGKLALNGGRPVVAEFSATLQPPPAPVVLIPFNGTVADLQAALKNSSGRIVVDMGNNMFRHEPVDVNSVTIYVDSTKPNDTVFIANNQFDMSKKYMFLADSSTGKLALQNNVNPWTKEVFISTAPVTKEYTAYIGDITGIQTGLANSFNTVMVADWNNNPIRTETVDANSLRFDVDPAKPGDSLYIVNRIGDTLMRFFFLADLATGKLALQDGKTPIVREMKKATGDTIQPPQDTIQPPTSLYRGTLDAVDTALTTSSDAVILVTGTGDSIAVTITRSTLASVADPKDAGQTIVVASRADDATKKVVFTAAGTATTLNVDAASNKPIVFDAPPELY